MRLAEPPLLRAFQFFCCALLSVHKHGAVLLVYRFYTLCRRKQAVGKGEPLASLQVKESSDPCFMLQPQADIAKSTCQYFKQRGPILFARENWTAWCIAV